MMLCCIAGAAFAVWKYRQQPQPQPPERRAVSVIEQMREAEEPKPLKIRAPVSIKLTK